MIETLLGLLALYAIGCFAISTGLSALLAGGGVLVWLLDKAKALMGCEP